MTRGSFMPLLCSGGSWWAAQQQGISVLCLPHQDHVCFCSDQETSALQYAGRLFYQKGV